MWFDSTTLFAMAAITLEGFIPFVCYGRWSSNICLHNFYTYQRKQNTNVQTNRYLGSLWWWN